MGEKPMTVKEMARMGGLARAKSHSKKQIREWGLRGGRPLNLDRSDIRRLRARLGRGEAKAIVAKKFEYPFAPWIGTWRAAASRGVTQLELRLGTVGTIGERLLPVRYSRPWSGSAKEGALLAASSASVAA